MKKLPVLTAATLAAGVALLVPTEAHACFDCETNSSGNATCPWDNQGNFGACTVGENFDECGESTGTFCKVWYDANCDTASNTPWDGWWSMEDWFCVQAGMCSNWE